MIKYINCFGYWADCNALGKDKKCLHLETCKSDWIKSGGRVGGIFDEITEVK